jgi:hypothetical protein
MLVTSLRTGYPLLDPTLVAALRIRGLEIQQSMRAIAQPPPVTRIAYSKVPQAGVHNLRHAWNVHWRGMLIHSTAGATERGWIEVLRLMRAIDARLLRTDPQESQPTPNDIRLTLIGRFFVRD